jgi:hypothetical protein
VVIPGGNSVVTVQAGDEIVQLAAQGNLQALSVYLNRHVIPSGAHVKVKSKSDALHILVVFMRATDDQKLLDSLKTLIIQLQPKQIGQIKLYSQILGKNQPTLRDTFTLVARSTQPISSSADDRTVLISAQQSPSESTIHRSQSPTQSTISAPEETRYSIAEYLSQITNLDELQILQRHPFFTGVCPHCQHDFQDTKTPPLFWDCPACGWKDDLSTLIPHHQLTEKRKSISFHESKRLGDYLVDAGLLTQSQIEVALEDQLNTGLRLGDVLVRRGWVKEETIEYLMQKIILPERSGAYQNAASYLESSRNLLKNLLKKNRLSETVPRNGINSAPEKTQTPQPPPRNAGKLAHERETLILPDLDIDNLS